jgi:hypothetical protein
MAEEVLNPPKMRDAAVLFSRGACSCLDFCPFEKRHPRICFTVSHHNVPSMYIVREAMMLGFAE